MVLLVNGSPYLSLGVGGSNHLLAAGTELIHAQATVEIWCVFFFFLDPGPELRKARQAVMLFISQASS